MLHVVIYTRHIYWTLILIILLIIIRLVFSIYSSFEFLWTNIITNKSVCSCHCMLYYWDIKPLCASVHKNKYVQLMKRQIGLPLCIAFYACGFYTVYILYHWLEDWWILIPQGIKTDGISSIVNESLLIACIH